MSLFCEVTVDRMKHTTVWFLLTMEDKDTGQNPGSIPNDPQFVLSGDIIFHPSITIHSNRNLTIVGFTTNLHGSTLFCGAEGVLGADFTFLVYGTYIHYNKNIL